MKMTKKKVFVAALAVCLVTTLSMGTLAWFTATDNVTNEFLLADSDSNGEADFSVDVKESDDQGTTWTDEGLTFDDILPGQTLPKLAVVKNTSTGERYSQYIRVTIEVVGAPAWQSGYIGADLKTSLDIDETVWRITSVTWDSATRTNKLVMYLRDVLEKDEQATIFETVTIPSKFVNDADSLFNLTDFTINIKAEAIQSESLGITDPDAVKAFALID